MNNKTKYEKIVIIISILFGLIYSLSTLFNNQNNNNETEINAFEFGVALLLFLPFAINSFIIIKSKKNNLISITLTTVINIIFYSLLYCQVFISPTSSTAAIGLIFLPIWCIIIFIPTGYFIGWLINKIFQY